MKQKIISCFLLLVITINCFSFYVSAKTSNVYHKINSDHKRIALTFDDGPHPRITREILGILEEYGVVATFFVIGQNAVNYPDTMALLAKSECEIGNHTYSHQNFRNMSIDQMKNEFEKCQRILIDNFSVEPTLMRPPEGFCSDSLYCVSDEMDYDIILWSIDTRDWAHTSAADISKNILDNVKGGDIVLMHDYTSGKSGTCDALRIIIPELLTRGFEFVTVSELIKK